MSFFGISATFVSLICSLVLVRGSFQASLLGISVVTGSARLYLPCNGHYLAIATKAPGRKRKNIILQSSVICYCGKMLVPGEVFCGSGLILCNCKFHVPGVRYFNFFTRSCASIPSHLHRCLRDLISRVFLVPYLFRIEHAAKIVNCVYTFLLRYCGTFI